MFGNINDVPDKSFEHQATNDYFLEEESKDRAIAPRTLQPPVELLGIPLECVVPDYYQDRVKLSPFAQKDSLLLSSNFFPSNPPYMKFTEFEQPAPTIFKYDEVYGPAANYEEPLPMLKNRSEISEDIYLEDEDKED